MRTWRVAWLVAAALLMTRSTDANLVPALSVDALVTQADLIVVGRVVDIASGADPEVGGIYTYVTIALDERLKGPSVAGPIVIKVLGGVVGSRGVHVPGQVRFARGEEALLFLGARLRDGSLSPLGFWQGKWSLQPTVDGTSRTAVMIEPSSGTELARLPVAAIRERIHQLPAADHRHALVNVNPADGPRQAAAFQLNDPRIRWTSPTVLVHAETGAQPGLASGGIAEINAATQQWNAAGSGLSLVPGSRWPPRCQSVVGTDILVTFADPCGEISHEPGVLAVAAYGYSLSNSQIINGQTFYPITDAVITTSRNPTVQSFLASSPCFQTTIAHELGHAVGLGHSQDATALMYQEQSASCFQSPLALTPDDVAGLRSIYPSDSLPPGSGAPGQATVLSAVATGGVLNLAWSVAAGSSPTAHRLDFFSGPNLVASVNVGAATTASIPIPPGTAGTFSVQVTAVTGQAAGSPSPPFTFTLGGSGAGGCTAAPARPAPSGSVSAGTATASWPAVPGATAYIVSAGSTPGGTNLYAATNVGAVTTVGASGLPASFSAWVRVVAVNACGQSAPADFLLQ